MDIAGLDLSVFPDSCPETRLSPEKRCTDDPEALLFSLIVFIRGSDDIICITRTGLYPNPHIILHINNTTSLIQTELLPSNLNIIFLLRYFSRRISTGMSP